MADVSLDKTDPQIKHIRPISDDLLTKFQLERPIILAYKVWTPYLPFEYKTVSWHLTQVTLPYDIQSITGIWYYKYEDIMDDKQRFVRESRMIKGDAVLDYRIDPCETYEGIEYCNNKIYFDIPLTSRKLWIEGVGQAEGYLEATESGLEPTGDFQLRRLNVYSESKQMIIPDSGSKELPLLSNSVCVKNNIVFSTVNNESGYVRNDNHKFTFVSQESGTILPTTYYSGDSLFTKELIVPETYSSNWSNDNYYIHQTSEAKELYAPNTYVYNDKWVCNGVQSTYSPERWVTFYMTLKQPHMTDESGHPSGDYVWARFYRHFTINSEIFINVNGNEISLLTGTGYVWDYSYSYVEWPGVNEISEIDGDIYFDWVHVSPTLKCQKKKFEVEDTKDAILGKYYTYRDTYIAVPKIEGQTGQTYIIKNYDNQMAVFLNHENGFITKTWPAIIENSESWNILGLKTYFDLTYVRL